MKCWALEECYGTNGNTDTLGTTLGTSEYNAKCQDATFHTCSKERSPYTDNVNGFYKGSVDIRSINISQCISRDVGLIGNFYSVTEEESINFIQAFQRREHNAVEVWYNPKTLTHLSIINCSLNNLFFCLCDAKVTVKNGCFFLKNNYNDYEPTEAYSCIFDSYTKATKNILSPRWTLL